MNEEKNSDIWSDDLLGRKEEAEFILNFLQNRTHEIKIQGQLRSYVLNLDGAWGQGKTFFLDHFHRELQSEGFLSIYVNAWKDDHADDPMIAVMSAIDETLGDRLKQRPALQKLWDATRKQGIRIAITAASSGLKKLVARFIGDGAIEIKEIINDYTPTSTPNLEIDTVKTAESITKSVEKFIDHRSEEALATFRDKKLSIDNFRSNLSNFISMYEKEEDAKTPLFILIDELDRCRPPYAIAMLERIKHFFDVPNVVFVIATDSQQLKHSIKAVYGQEFDSNRYLRRFFDRTYDFAAPSNKNLINFLFEKYKLQSPVSIIPNLTQEQFFEKISIAGNLGPRDIYQCYEHLRTICTIWGERCPIELLYLIPLIVSFHQGDQDTFELLSQANTEAAQFRKIKMLDFKVEHRSIDRNGPRTTSSEAIDILVNLLRYAKIPLISVGREDPSGAYGAWAQQQILNEFQTLHQGRITQGDQKFSILRDYSVIVRNAGRLIIKYDK